jgi:hypothetical protein
MSFYSGPVPYFVGDNKPSDHWKHIGWNPIQAGDAHGNGSELTAFEKRDDGLYVKCIPLHWPLDHVPGECTFETWITLEENRAQVRCRFVNARSDKTDWSPRSQELPAVYTNGPYYRLMTYTGAEPWTDGPLSKIENPTEGDFPWNFWAATENWAALVNDQDWGLGIYHPGAYHWIGGFAGKPGKGGTHDSPCGYMAPLQTEHLDHNITYEYTYTLVLDDLEAIRAWVKEEAAGKRHVAWTFEEDRGHWVRRSATDQGWPLEGEWQLTLSPGATLESPWTLWEAEAFPTLEITASSPEQTSGRVCWREHGSKGYEHCADFTLPAGTEARTVSVPLSEAEGYAGSLAQLRLQFPEAHEGQRLTLEAIKLVAGGDE